MGADACPVPEGEGSWLSHWEKLATEAPVNGGCNYNAVLKLTTVKDHTTRTSCKIWLYAGISRYSCTTQFSLEKTSNNVTSRDNQQERASCTYMNFDAKKIKLEVGFYLAGFTDAEGCFHVGFSPKRNQNSEITSWKVRPSFSVAQKERHIVAQFKKHLKCGTVNTNEKTNVSTYTVSSIASV